MCVAASGPKGPPGLSPEEKAEQDRIKAEEEAARLAKEQEEKRKQAEAKEQRLEEQARQQSRGGTGSRSLLTGASGGKGYFEGQI